MHFHTGRIEVICGSMFSGKTEELMRRLRRAVYGRQRVQVFKPVLDNRYSREHVQSHDSNKMTALPLERAWDILARVGDNTRVVGIDEAQFFDEGLTEVCQKLANRGVRVILAGLDQDFRGQPFGPMPTLLSVAEEVTKLSAVCVICGAPASRTQRTTEAVTGSPRGEPQILVGAKEIYEARCRSCHEVSETQLNPGLLTRVPNPTQISDTPEEAAGAG